MDREFLAKLARFNQKTSRAMYTSNEPETKSQRLGLHELEFGNDKFTIVTAILDILFHRNKILFGFNKNQSELVFAAAEWPRSSGVTSSLPAKL